MGKLIYVVAVLILAFVCAVGWEKERGRAAIAAADRYEEWAKSQRMIEVSFVVAPPAGTRDDETLFLCGRAPGFGALDPAGVKLVRSPDGKYRGSVELLSGIDHQFCVTRGSYESIEADASNGQPNWRNEVIAGKDAVEVTVDRWVDEPVHNLQQCATN